MRRLWAFGLLHFHGVCNLCMVLGLWDGELCVYPTCFALESLSISMIIRYHQTYLPTSVT
jgi:uncharacterized membrane protein